MEKKLKEGQIRPMHITIKWKKIYFTEQKTGRDIKGQMSQKIDIFSFVALPSPNTKKNHPKCDLGEDFSSQAFIER